MPDLNQVICFLWSILETNFFSSLIGGFLAALLFWTIFQDRIRKLIDYRETKRISGNFLGELLYNHIVASKNISKADYYFESKQMNVLEYETDSIAEFIKREPLDLGVEFYKRLQVFYSAGLKKDNMLLKIHWFSPSLTVADMSIAKKNYLDNSRSVLKQITKILNNKKLLSLMKKMGLTDDIKRKRVDSKQ